MFPSSSGRASTVPDHFDDGKGSLSDIVIATAYALTPIILANLPATLFSNFTVQKVLLFFFYLSLIWSMVCSLERWSLTITVLEACFVILLTLAGIGIAFFIGMLFIDIVLQLFGFFVEVY